MRKGWNRWMACILCTASVLGLMPSIQIGNWRNTEVASAVHSWDFYVQD